MIFHPAMLEVVEFQSGFDPQEPVAMRPRPSRAATRRKEEEETTISSYYDMEILLYKQQKFAI